MADDVLISAGTGTVIATDDVAGRHFQRVKPAFGADGTATDVSATTPLPVDFPGATTAAVTSVASSATSVTLLASNAARRLATFFNESTATLYLKFGATASATSYTVQVGPGQLYELPRPAYTGVIDGIWSAANGNARITEV